MAYEDDLDAYYSNYNAQNFMGGGGGGGGGASWLEKLSGLLGSGSADIYGDLLSDKQKSALLSREISGGLSEIAKRAYEAGKPSLMPGGGGALGYALSGYGAGADAAGEGILKTLGDTQKIKALIQQRKFADQIAPIWQKILADQGLTGGAKPAAAPPAGVPTAPPGAPAAPLNPAAPPGTAAPAPPWSSSVPAQSLSPYLGIPQRPRGGLLGAASEGPLDQWGNPAPPGYRYAPDGTMRALPNDPEEQAGLLGGGGGSGAPFSLASLGQGQGLPDLGQIRVEPLSGEAAPAGFGASREGTVAYWKSRGAPDHVAQGIADRVNAESGFKPGIMGDKGTSGGLYQHHADRLTRLQDYAASQGRPWTDPDVQHRFAGTETQGGDAIATRGMPAIMAAPDRATAGKLWDRYFERSAAGPGAYRGGSGGAPDLSNMAGDAGGGGDDKPAGSGLVPGLGITPEALAALNAMSKLGGLGEPFGSLLETYYKSPGYLGEVKRQSEEIETEFAGKKAGAAAAATQKYIQENETHKSGLELARDLIGKGVYLDKATGTMKPITNAAEALAEIDRVKAENKAKNEIVTVTLTLPGESQPREMQMTAAQARNVLEGKPEPSLGIPSMTGIKIGKPVYSQEDIASQAAEQKVFDEKRTMADTARKTIQNSNDLRAQIERGVIAGPYADTRTQLAKVGQLLGLTGKDDNATIANTESYVASLGKNLKEGLAGLGPPVSNTDVQIAERIMAAGQNVTAAGVLQLLELREKYQRAALKEYNESWAPRAPKSRYERTIAEPPTYGARQFRDPRTGRVYWENKEAGRFQDVETGKPWEGEAR